MQVKFCFLFVPYKKKMTRVHSSICLTFSCFFAELKKGFTISFLAK